ncbi:hypothetical protein V865_006535 [Kwoniella europaea PYCC6329]|uniref:Uncharacterized protein n=1 Tax=Kwoniella europaea PYCC6329 TaxID=1423913 RepID=A0AAX4KSZ3_9TREE
MSTALPKFFSTAKRAVNVQDAEPSGSNVAWAFPAFVHRVKSDTNSAYSSEGNRTFVIRDEDRIFTNGPSNCPSFEIRPGGSWEVSFSANSDRMTLTFNPHTDQEGWERPIWKSTFVGCPDQEISQIVIEGNGLANHGYSKSKSEPKIADADEAVVNGVIYYIWDLPKVDQAIKDNDSHMIDEDEDSSSDVSEDDQRERDTQSTGTPSRIDTLKPWRWCMSID